MTQFNITSAALTEEDASFYVERDGKSILFADTGNGGATAFSAMRFERIKGRWEWIETGEYIAHESEAVAMASRLLA